MNEVKEQVTDLQKKPHGNKGKAHTIPHVSLFKEDPNRLYKWWENEKGEASNNLVNLCHALSMGCTDKEACVQAEISETQLYYYQKINPRFLQYKAALKEKPILKARERIYESLDTSVETAKWYLERKRKDEFSTKHILEPAFVAGQIPEEEAKRIDDVLQQNGFNALENSQKKSEKSGENDENDEGLSDGIIEAEIIEDETIL